MILAIASAASVLIPLFLAIVQWSKLQNLALLRWILICSAISDTVQFIMALGFGMHNLFVGNTFLFIQFALLLFIFRLQFEPRKNYTIIFGTLIVLHGIVLILSGNNADVTSLLNAMAGLVLIVVSVFFFYKLINELKVENIHRQPIVWIAFATLFYYSGNLFVFVAFNYLLSNTEDFQQMWTLHQILNITKNILFAVALWQSYRAVKLSA